MTLTPAAMATSRSAPSLRAAAAAAALVAGAAALLGAPGAAAQLLPLETPGKCLDTDAVDPGFPQRIPGGFDPILSGPAHVSSPTLGTSLIDVLGATSLRRNCALRRPFSK